MRKRIFAIFGLLGLLVAAPLGTERAASAEKTDPESAAEAIRTDLDRILAEAGLRGAIIAARVLDLSDGKAPSASAEVLYSVRADQPLVPASVMKLITTAACWDRLGPDWRIRTYVGHIPPEDEGQWPDLAVIGGGDPNFSGRFYDGDPVGAFRAWAAVLKKRGIPTVRQIILDDGLFEAQVVHPHWPPDQRQRWYAAPVGALSLNDNCVDVYVAPSEVGKPARLGSVPPTSYVRLVGSITTVAERKEHRFSLTRLAKDAPPGAAPAVEIQATGQCWVEAAPRVESVAVPDPTAYFGAALAETLRAEGISVAGPIVRQRLVGEAGAAPRFVCDIIHTSRLDATVAVANKRSQGLYAECLLKLLGAFGSRPNAVYAPGHVSRRERPREGSWQTGAEEMRRWLAERGIPTDGCILDDGSGLSRGNRLTAWCVTELLRVMSERHGEGFIQTLAVAGRDGSLRGRMRGTAAEGRVWAKTGYLAGVSTLSGYVQSKSGRWRAFSILINGVPSGQLWRARLAQDKVCIRLVDE